MKQSKLRRRRVFRYAIMYFVMLVVFLALIIGPAVGGKMIKLSPPSTLNDYHLIQPTGQNNNDTNGRIETGTRLKGKPAATTTDDSSQSSQTPTTTADSGQRIRLF
jgi:1,3-beta-glucan synthase